MKATYGRVSRAGAVARSWTLDHVGPLTRTVRDNARVLAAIAGHDPNDSTTSEKPVPDYEAALEGGVSGYSYDQCVEHYRQSVGYPLGAGMALIGAMDIGDGRGLGGAPGPAR